jgi:AsmA protein
LRLLFIVLGGIVALLAAVVFVGPLFISTDALRKQLLTQVESQTGYRLRISGPISISLFPSIDLVVDDIGVAQPTAQAATEFAKAKRLRVGLGLMPLLSGKVKVSALTLVEPIIAVPQTQPQTQAQAPQVQAPSQPSTQPNPSEAPQSGLSSVANSLKSLSLDSLVIKNGTLILPPSGGKPGTRIDNVMLEASLSSFDGPLSFDLRSIYGGQNVGVAGAIQQFGPFLQGGTVPVSLKLDAPSYLAQPVTLSGNAAYNGKAFALSALNAKAGDSAITGTISGDMSGAVPHVKASLKGDALDLDALLPKSGGNAGATSGAAKPIDFSPLDSMTADIDIAFKKLIVSGLAATPLVATANVAGGKLNIVASQVGVGGGQGSATLLLDPHRDTPYLGGKVRITGVDLGLASKLAGKSLPVTGTAGADVAFATVGRTVAELKSRINASGALTLNNGVANLSGLGDVVGDPKANRIEAISLNAAFKDLVKPVTVTGGATWHGQRFNLSAVGDVRGILAGKSSAVDVKAASQMLTAGFNGSVSQAGLGNGRLSLQTASLTNLMRWLGQTPGWQSGFQAFSINGNLTVAANAVSFANTSFKLDNTSGTGNGKIRLGKKPSVQAQLSLDTLDVTPYLGDAGKQQAAGGGPTGWSDARIDFSALNAIDASLGLAAKQFIYKQIKTGAVTIQATISGGKLDAKLPSLKLYNGTGNGSLSVDASSKTPKQAFKFALKDLAAYPFLRDAAGFESIEGTGAMNLDLTASGASQRAIVSALNGTAKFQFNNGAIRGINIASLMRNLTSGVLTGWQGGQAQKTDFAVLSASFKVAQGQATNNDLQLIGPLVRMKGAGTVNMPAKTVNFRVDPQLVASLEGQGSKGDLAGLGVPVMVSGPWSNPKIYPDIAGILQNPTAAYDQLRKLGGGLFNLPGLGNPGAAAGIGALPSIVQGGKINKDALTQGLGTLLGNQNGAMPPATGSTPKVDAVATPKPDTGPTPKTNTGSTPKTNTGSTPKANQQPSVKNATQTPSKPNGQVQAKKKKQQTGAQDEPPANKKKKKKPDEEAAKTLPWQ